MSTATANGDASSKGAQPASKQFKPSAAGKALDGARKQAGSPVDAQNRSVTPTKQSLVQRPRRPPHVSAPPSLILLALFSRPTIAYLFAFGRSYSLVMH